MDGISRLLLFLLSCHTFVHVAFYLEIMLPAPRETFPTVPQLRRTIDQGGTRRFYAVRRCSNLRGPAIFCCWEDCSSLMRIDDTSEGSGARNNLSADYEEFEALSDAVAFVEAFLEGHRKSFCGLGQHVETSEMPIANDRIQNSRNLTRKRQRSADNLNSTAIRRGTEKRSRNQTYSISTALLKSPPAPVANFCHSPLPSGDDSLQPLAAAAAAAASYETGASVESCSRTSKKSGKDDLHEKRDNFQKTFPHNVKRLEQFRAKYGDCDIPHRKGDYRTKNGKTIDMAEFVGMGQWCNQIRNQIKIYQLSPKLSKLRREQYLQLKGIGFCMDPRRFKEVPLKKKVWDEKKFVELEQFKEMHGHCNVPRDPKTPLRYWLDKVRTAYTDLKEGRPSTLTEEQISRLTNLGFVLKSKITQISFNDYVDQWKLFKAENPSGNRGPPSTSSLGIWIARMRRKYKEYQKGLKTTITAAQVTRLDEIGFQWKSRHTHLNYDNKKRQPPKTFEQRYAELVEYKQNYGNLYVRKSYPGLG